MRRVTHTREPVTETLRGEPVFVGHIPDPGIGLISSPGDEDYTILVETADGMRHYQEFTGRADFVRSELGFDGARIFRDPKALIVALDDLVQAVRHPS